jgi:hypothetical protein
VVWEAGEMRAGRYLIAAAGVGVLTAGCGTVHAGQSQPSAADVLAAAVTGTSTQTARIEITEAIQATGMSVSFTQTGEFDFANSRGMLTMSAPADMTELFLPPKVYLKVSSPAGGTVSHGKTWIEMDTGTMESESSPLGLGLGGSPADLLASLTAIAGSERIIGATSIRGVPVTEYQVNIDPAKMAAKVPSRERASLSQFATSFGKGSVPVDVWVDHQNLVRQVRLSVRMPGQAGEPASVGKMELAVTIDFFDFGVPVRVSAPPAAQVTSISGQSAAISVGVGGIASASAAASAMPVVSYAPGSAGSAGSTGSAASAVPAPPTMISSPLPQPSAIGSPMP